MAVGASDAAICNLALLRIGNKSFITTLSDASAQAQACNLAYANARDSMLTEFQWPWANRQAQLAQLTIVRSGWAVAYALPSDCVEPRFIFSGVRPGALSESISATGNPVLDLLDGGFPVNGIGQTVPFTVELSDDGTTPILLSDMTSAVLIYTSNGGGPNAWPQTFIEALAWRVAADLALGLPNKQDRSTYCEARYKEKKAQAIAASLRAVKEDAPADSEFIAVRG